MPTIEASNAVGPLCMIIAILFGGFYIDIESLPVVADYVPWISFQRWFFQAATINEYRGLTFTCGSSGYACKTTGEAVLESLSFNGHTTAYGVFGLSMCMLGILLYTLAVMCATVDSYLKLGFAGSKFAQMESEGTLVADVERSDLFLTAVRESAEKQAEAGAGEGSADEVGIELT